MPQPDSLKWIVEHLERDPRVHEVAYNAAVVENIDANVSRLGLMVLGFTVLAIDHRDRLDQQHDTPGDLQQALPDPHHAPGGRHAVVHQETLPRPKPVARRRGLRCWPSDFWWACCNGIKRYMPDLLAFTDMVTLAMLFGGVVVLGFADLLRSPLGSRCGATFA